MSPTLSPTTIQPHLNLEHPTSGDEPVTLRPGDIIWPSDLSGDVMVLTASDGQTQVGGDSAADEQTQGGVDSTLGGQTESRHIWLNNSGGVVVCNTSLAAHRRVLSSIHCTRRALFIQRELC